LKECKAESTVSQYRVNVGRSLMGVKVGGGGTRDPILFHTDTVVPLLRDRPLVPGEWWF